MQVNFGDFEATGRYPERWRLFAGTAGDSVYARLVRDGIVLASLTGRQRLASVPSAAFSVCALADNIGGTGDSVHRAVTARAQKTENYRDGLTDNHELCSGEHRARKVPGANRGDFAA